jgi:hypothetical protein
MKGAGLFDEYVIFRWRIIKDAYLPLPALLIMHIRT